MVFDGLSSLVAPRHCVACRSPLRAAARAGDWRDALCPTCLRGVRRIATGCLGCGRELGPHAAPQRRCAHCQGPTRAIASTTALLRYRGPARTLLRRLKYEGRHELAAPLGRELAAVFGARHPEAAADPRLVVVPIPLHPWRRWRRGFNQAEAIAAGVASALGRPVRLALRRRRATQPLYGVAREERAAAVADAFQPGRGGRRAVAGRAVALVDDIRTSGATLETAARALRAAGAARVHALAVGR